MSETPRVEVHLFEATAKAIEDNDGPYRPGHRHALLIFCGQPKGSDHDFEQAERLVGERGWRNVVFQRAEVVAPPQLNGKNAAYGGAWQHAMLGGCGVIVYRDPIAVD